MLHGLRRGHRTEKAGVSGRYAQPVRRGFEGSRRLDLGGQGLVGIRDCGRIDVMRPTTPPRRSPSLAPPLRTFIHPAAGTVAEHLPIRVRDFQTVQGHVRAVPLLSLLFPTAEAGTSFVMVTAARGPCQGYSDIWYVSPGALTPVYGILHTHCFRCRTRARRSGRTRARWGAVTGSVDVCPRKNKVHLPAAATEPSSA